MNSGRDLGRMKKAKTKKPTTKFDTVLFERAKRKQEVIIIKLLKILRYGKKRAQYDKVKWRTNEEINKNAEIKRENEVEDEKLSWLIPKYTKNKCFISILDKARAHTHKESYCDNKVEANKRCSTKSFADQRRGVGHIARLRSGVMYFIIYRPAYCIIQHFETRFGLFVFSCSSASCIVCMAVILFGLLNITVV